MSVLDLRCPLCALEVPGGCVCPLELRAAAKRELERELRLTCSELVSRKHRTITVTQEQLKQRRFT
jgi:hypothetical protein